MKARKKERTEEHCKNIQKGMMSGNSKEANNTIKAIVKTSQHKSAVTEDNGGDILTESTTVLNRWTEYCCGPYNYELHPDNTEEGLIQALCQNSSSAVLLNSQPGELFNATVGVRQDAYSHPYCSTSS